jgi:hypothetical protein
MERGPAWSQIAGLRRSMKMVSRQLPWCWPMRWRVPTSRNPAAWWRARLAVFSGKMLDWMVQIPAVSVEAMRAVDAAVGDGRGGDPA